MLNFIKKLICKIFGLFCNNNKEYYKPIKTYKPELKEEVKPDPHEDNGSFSKEKHIPSIEEEIEPKIIDMTSEVSKDNEVTLEPNQDCTIIVPQSKKTIKLPTPEIEEENIPSVESKIEDRMININEVDSMKNKDVKDKEYEKNLLNKLDILEKNKLEIDKFEKDNKVVIKETDEQNITKVLQTIGEPDKSIKEIIESTKEIEKIVKDKEVIQTEDKVIINKNVAKLIKELKKNEEDKEILVQPKYTEESEEPMSTLISWNKNKEITKKEVKEKIESTIVNKDEISMYRIVLCWSMSENKFKGLDQNRYHFVVDQDCNILHGNFDISDNLDIEYNKKPRGTYAIPTRGLNDNTISIAMLGMKDYKVNHDNKIITGTHPINRKQYDVFCILAYHLSNIYDINIDLESIITRSEIEPVLGKKQKSNTYDFKFLPFDFYSDHVNPDPTILGEKIRDSIFHVKNY